MSSLGEPILVVEGISKSYRNGPEILEVLRSVRFTVNRGEMVSIVGHSGVGKTTLLNLVGALDRPTHGEIVLDGVRLARLGDGEMAEIRARRVGFVFQMFQLLPEFTALENVLVPMLLVPGRSRRARVRAEELLEKVGVAERRASFPWQLSGGEQQRVAIARALANDPDILLADEPTGNLDEVAADRVMALLWELVRERRRTLLLATHQEELARRTGRVLRIVDGAIREEYHGGRGKTGSEKDNISERKICAQERGKGLGI